MAGEKSCPKCGSSVQISANYCSQCAAPLTATSRGDRRKVKLRGCVKVLIWSVVGVIAVFGGLVLVAYLGQKTTLPEEPERQRTEARESPPKEDPQSSLERKVLRYLRKEEPTAELVYVSTPVDQGRLEGSPVADTYVKYRITDGWGTSVEYSKTLTIWKGVIVRESQ